MTAVFQGVNPACIGDASTGPLLAVVVSADGFDIHREFQTFKDAYGFPSAVEPERDEWGECGPGIVSEEHAAATSKAVDLAMADVRGRSPRDDAELGNGWEGYPKVWALFITWLAQRPEIVVETSLHYFTTPLYYSTVPTWTLEDDGDLCEEDEERDDRFDPDEGCIPSGFRGTPDDGGPDSLYEEDAIGFDSDFGASG